jgi:hypothetical protein
MTMSQWQGVVAHHPLEFCPLAIGPGGGMTGKSDHFWLLLIHQHLDISEPYDVMEVVRLNSQDTAGSPSPRAMHAGATLTP